MPCTIPVSLFDRGMLLQELAPAAVLFACAVGLAFYRGLEPRKKVLSVAIICTIGLMTSTSTAMLAFRSKVVVQDDTVTFYAGRWKAQLPVAALRDASATNQIGASLRKRTNGFSSRQSERRVVPGRNRSKDLRAVFWKWTDHLADLRRVQPSFPRS